MTQTATTQAVTRAGAGTVARVGGTVSRCGRDTVPVPSRKRVGTGFHACPWGRRA